MDDSGKTGHQLIVGSIWFLSDFRSVHRAILDIRQRSGFKDEFHFKNLKPEDLSIYQEVVDVLWQNSNTVGLKLISVPRSGLAKGPGTLTDLYYHLLTKGIEHEAKTNRAPLPRTLQVWIDAEEASLDKLRIANLEDRLEQAARSRFGGNLAIDRLLAVDSKTNVIIQMADLFTASANRVLNVAAPMRNHKDEFAQYLLGRFGIDPSLPENDTLDDLAVHVTV